VIANTIAKEGSTGSRLLYGDFGTSGMQSSNLGFDAEGPRDHRR